MNRRRKLTAIATVLITVLLTVSFSIAALATGEERMDKETWYNRKHNINTTDTPYSGESRTVALTVGGAEIDVTPQEVGLDDGWILAESDRVTLHRIVTSNGVSDCFDPEFSNLVIDGTDDGNVIPQTVDSAALYAFDDNPDTKWVSERGQKARYIIDFGQPLPITEITLRYTYNSLATLKLSYSNDAPAMLYDHDGNGNTPRLPVINANSTAEDYHGRHFYEAGVGASYRRVYNNINWYNFDDEPLCQINDRGETISEHGATVVNNNLNGVTVFDAQNRIVRFLELEITFSAPSVFELIDIVPTHTFYENYLSDEVATVTASSTMNNEYFAEGAMDGGWTPNGFDQWISAADRPDEAHWLKFDLGKSRELSMVRIYHAPYVASPCRDYTIYGSNEDNPDFSSWKVLSSVENNAYYYADHNVQGNYRYVAIYITDTGLPDNCARIAEVMIYGTRQVKTNYALATSPNFDFSDAVPAIVPGSVHTALVNAGRIPDPKVGMNYRFARQASYSTFVLKKLFHTPIFSSVTLSFGGIADRCQIWLNGTYLGYHQGMFTAIEYDVDNLLKRDGTENELIVRLLPALYWEDTVVFSNAYGWHYANVPPLGIWRSVKLKHKSAVTLDTPFLSTETLASDHSYADLRLTADIMSETDGDGSLYFTLRKIWPNEGSILFSARVDGVTVIGGRGKINFRFRLQNPDLWWPNLYGEQNLYEADFKFELGSVADCKRTEFGVREIKMLPAGGKESPDMYNWQFEVNGVDIYARGANWCTMDAMMDFSSERYEHFLSLAKNGNMNFMRLWGSGMPETDECYYQLDRLGLMALQEWPNAWGAAPNIPYYLLKETVIENTKRLRNHPSLVIYTGGNEITEVRDTGKAIAMMAQVYYKYDGTRFFRVDDGGWHNYAVGWGYSGMDYNLTNSVFTDFPIVGEFGLQSMSDYKSVKKYLGDFDESTEWPVATDALNAFTLHTPTFNHNGLKRRGEDMTILYKYAQSFTSAETLERFVFGSQLAQAISNRAVLERSRCNYPASTAINFYKMNDNFPGASWSVVDYYGVPKIAYYATMQALAPVAAYLAPDSFNPGSVDMRIPVYVLDDIGKLNGYTVEVSAYDCELSLVKAQRYTGNRVDRVARVGDFTLSADNLRADRPTFLHVSVFGGEEKIFDTFYFLNFEKTADSILTYPNLTTLSVERRNGCVAVTNTGAYPALGVTVADGETHDGYEYFRADEGYLWLQPNETKIIRVTDSTHAVVRGWNTYEADNVGFVPKTRDFKATKTTGRSITLSWTGEAAGSRPKNYELHRDGTRVARLGGDVTTYTDERLAESTDYVYELYAVSFDGGRSEAALVPASTLADYEEPRITNIFTEDAMTVRVKFNKPLSESSYNNFASFTVAGEQVVSVRADGEDVLLTLASPLRAGEAYLLTADVTDAAANRNAAQSSKVFFANVTAKYGFTDGGADDAGGGYALTAVGCDERNFVSYDYGIYFAATSEGTYLQIEDSPVGPSKGAFTLSFSLAAEESSALRAVLAKKDKTKGHFELYLSGGTMFMYSIGEKEDLRTVAENVTDGIRRRFALTYADGTYKVYVDGVRTRSFSGTNEFYGLSAFCIGGLVDGGLPALGTEIGDVAWYNCELSSNEIRNLHSDYGAASRLKSFAYSDTDYVTDRENGQISVCVQLSDYSTVSPDTVTYSSSDDSVVTVDADGTVRFVSEGRAIVNVAYTYGGNTYYEDILVRAYNEKDPAQSEIEQPPHSPAKSHATVIALTVCGSAVFAAGIAVLIVYLLRRKK